MDGAEPGTTIDRKYRVVRQLGEGGMGRVYVVEHLFLAKKLALKLLHDDVARRPEIAARFEREARATSRIEHEHVVRVTDFGKSDEGQLYLVMELLTGRSLHEVLGDHGRLPIARALSIAKQMLSG